MDKKKLRKVALLHMSWSQIHTEAVIERVNRSVADPDQAWILAELIRYLEHERSGAVDFDDMGKSWVSVRDATEPHTARQRSRCGRCGCPLRPVGGVRGYAVVAQPRC